MNHPTREEWMSYLYGETHGAERVALVRHLAECARCREQVEQWQGVRRGLDAWRLAKAPRVTLSRGFVPVLRWAVAAGFMVIVAFGVGRATGPRTVDAGGLREELLVELNDRVREQVAESASAVLAAAESRLRVLLSEFVQAYEERRSVDMSTVLAAVQELETGWASDYLSLRKDLETVALHSDVGLRRTRQDLIRLTDYNRPERTVMER
jgi:anti-sigma factor RsiW